MSTFRDFLQWNINKNVFPTLETMHTMIEFNHDKGKDMLILDCSPRNLANSCLHNLTDYTFYAFFSSDIDLLEKIREDTMGDPSIVFTRKAVANEMFFRKLNVCKLIVGIDASQIYPYSLCQVMLTGL